MPIYEYQCRNCGHCFEQLVFSSNGQEEVRCPSCDATDTKRLLSAFACGSGTEGAGSGISSSGCRPTGGFS